MSFWLQTHMQEPVFGRLAGFARAFAVFLPEKLCEEGRLGELALRAVFGRSCRRCNLIHLEQQPGLERTCHMPFPLRLGLAVGAVKNQSEVALDPLGQFFGHIF